jgi:dipeptidyl aminopeptidase/acylaminoacyl peptidase
VQILRVSARSNLLGENPTAVDAHPNEKQIDKNTPPAILLLSDDDKAVPPENSLKYYEALKKNGIPAACIFSRKAGMAGTFVKRLSITASWRSCLLNG